MSYDLVFKIKGFLPLRVWSRLSSLVDTKTKILILLTLIFAIIQGLLELTFIWKFSSLMNIIIEKNDYQYPILLKQLILVILISFVLFLTKLITLASNSYTTSYAGIQIGKKSIKSLLSSNLNKINEYKEGELIARIGSKLDLVISYVISPFIELVNSYVLSTILVIVLCKTIGMFMFSILLCLLLIKQLSNSILSKRISILGKIISRRYDILAQLVKQSVRSFKEIFAYQRQKLIYKEYVNSIQDLWFSNAKSNFLSLIPKYALDFLSFIPVYFLILVSINQNGNQDASTNTISTLIIYTFIVARLLPLFNQIIINTSSVMKGLAFLTDVEEIIYKLKPDILKSYENSEDKALRGIFGDSTGNYLISDGEIDLNLKEGQLISIVGESGVGKTSFIDRSIELRTDSNKVTTIKAIKSDFVDSSQINKKIKVSMNQISYMCQETPIISGTVLDNLFIDKLNTNQLEKIEKICIAFGVDKIFEDPSNFLYAHIKDNGSNLSGGQRKRIGLARAFVKDSKIIILDEPTAGIDNLSSSFILKNVRNQFLDRVVIIITHDTNIIKLSDSIFEVVKLVK